MLSLILFFEVFQVINSQILEHLIGDDHQVPPR